MEDGRISRRYALALFGAAKRYDLVRGVETDLDAIVAAMRADEGFRHFLIAPQSSREEKMKVVERVFSDRVTALTMQALRVMLEKGRESEIEAVRAEFVRLRREDTGILYATVSSAEPLSEGEKQAVLGALGRSLGKTVEADFRTEPGLIGGVRVAYENYVLDGSARGALDALRERLRYDLLKQL